VEGGWRKLGRSADGGGRGACGRRRLGPAELERKERELAGTLTTAGVGEEICGEEAEEHA
jgi:hypothetical protein